MKELKTLVLLLIMSMVINSCNNTRDANAKISGSTLKLDIADSVLASLPVLSDNCFLKETTLKKLKGWELDRDNARQLVFGSIGIFYPKGEEVGQYEKWRFDFEVLPKYHLYLIGKWETKDSVNILFISERYPSSDYSALVYLLTEKDGVIKDATVVAGAVREGLPFDPITCKRLSRNTFSVQSTVYMFDTLVDGDCEYSSYREKETFSIRKDGKIHSRGKSTYSCLPPAMSRSSLVMRCWRDLL